MKNKKEIFKCIVVPALVGVLFCLPLLSGNIYTGYDFSFHLSRLSGIRSAISDLQFPIAVYTNKNYGFGYASPLFYCDLFLILPSMLSYIGIDYRYIYIFVVLLFNVLGCIVLFNFLLKRYGNYKNSLITLIAFEFSTMHILDVYRRSGFGSITSSVFILSVFCMCYVIFEDNVTDLKSSIFLAISFSGILLTHNLSFFLTCFVFGLVCLFNLKTMTKEHIICIIKAIVIAISISAFFLLPMLEQMIDGDFMYSHYSMWYNSNLTPLRLFNNFIISKKDICTPGIVAVVTTIFAVVNKKRISKLSFKLALISLITIFLSTSLSPLPYIKELSFIQFPWRLSSVVICITPYLLCDILKSYKISNITRLLFVVAMGTNFIFGIKQMYSDPDCVLYKSEPIESAFAIEYPIRWNYLELLNAEYLPNTEDMDYKHSNGCIMHSNLDDLECLYDRNGSRIEVSLNNEFDDNIMFPLTYYKGYSVYEIIDGNKIKLNVEPSEYYKLVSIRSEKGEHKYIAKYEGTLIQKISIIISLASVLFAIIYIFNLKKKLKIN